MKPQLNFKEWLSQQPVNEIGPFFSAALGLGRDLAGKGTPSNAIRASDLPRGKDECEPGTIRTKRGCMKVMGVERYTGDDGQDTEMVKGIIKGKYVVLPKAETELARG